MKKRTAALFGVLLVCVLCVFVVGVLLKKNREQEQQTAESETETAAEAAVSDEEQEFLDQVISDAEQIESEGNIYDAGEYWKYGGFGYQVVELRLYDTYDDLHIENYDEKKVGEPAYYYPEASYACLELQVTNEGGVEKTLYPSAIHLVCAENWMRGEPENSFSAGWCNVSRTIYVDGIENSQDDPKNSANPVIGPGETVTLLLYYEYNVETLDENGKQMILSIKDKFENPDYYIELRGTINSGDPNYIYDITKNKHCIYLKCTTVEG